MVIGRVLQQTTGVDQLIDIDRLQGAGLLTEYFRKLEPLDRPRSGKIVNFGQSILINNID